MNQISDWVYRWTHLLTPQSRVLDVACGLGRHSLYLSELGHRVTAVDVNVAALHSVTSTDSRIETISADLENAQWPFADRQFDCVVVTNYLWRSLFPDLLGALTEGGILIYETFAMGNESVGKPSRSDFLLQRGELLQTCAGLQIIAFEDGFMSEPDRFVQRIAASKITGSLKPESPQKFQL